MMMYKNTIITHASLLRRGIHLFTAKRFSFLCVVFIGWTGLHPAAHAALNCTNGQYLVKTELIDFFQPTASGDGMMGLGYLEDANGFTWLTFGNLPAWSSTPLFETQEVCVPVGQYTFAYFVDAMDFYPEELYFWIYVDGVQVLFGGGGTGDSYYSTMTDNFYLDLFWVKEGCTNPTATNYDPQAPIDDGSCTCPNGNDAIDLNVTIFDTYGEGNDGYGAVTDLDGKILYLTDIYWNQNCESYGYMSPESWQTYCSGNLSQVSGPYALCPGDYLFSHSIDLYPEEFSFELIADSVSVGAGDHASLPYPFQLGINETLDAGDEEEQEENPPALDAGEEEDEQEENPSALDAGDEEDQEENPPTLDAGDEEDQEEPPLALDAGDEEDQEETSPTFDAGEEEEENPPALDAGLIGVALPPLTNTDESDAFNGQVLVQSGCGCTTSSSQKPPSYKYPFLFLFLCLLPIRKRIS